MIRGSPLFTPAGEARFVPTCVTVLVISTLAAIRSPWGFMQYKSTEILTVMVPIAGTVLALALPAAQLAQQVVEGFLSSVGELSKQPVDELFTLFSDLAVKRRRVLASMYCVIVYSLCSFLLGAAGFLGMFGDVKLKGLISLRDWVACTSLGFLIASVLWFMPVVRASFNTSLINRIIRLLEEAKKSIAKAQARPATVAGPVPGAPRQ